MENKKLTVEYQYPSPISELQETSTPYLGAKLIFG